MQHSIESLTNQYDILILQINSVIKMPAESVQNNIEKLIALENLKYSLTYLMAEIESRLLSSRAVALKQILADDTNKKVLSSSTLTNVLIEDLTKDDQGMYRMLQEQLRNVRGSLDVNRSLLSAEKILAGMSDVH